MKKVKTKLEAKVKKISENKISYGILSIMFIFFVFIILLDCAYHDLFYCKILEEVWNKLRTWKEMVCPMISYQRFLRDIAGYHRRIDDYNQYISYHDY